MRLSPIVMTPAFRHGSATPWGGDGLRRLFDKDIPDDSTGESLEVSAIPGLESRDTQGNTLGALIARHGAALLGDAVMGEFPLLLKLIDARETLSVQVHPGDAYAAANEGKLGKTEAWVILDAAPGASIVYGVRPGVTKAGLRKASESGEGVERLLRRVPVRAGDVFHIPAGMVHAIGGGIILYEIQQSSDVTYRFYDWNRADASGHRRPLHIRQALDVADAGLQLDKAAPQMLDWQSCRAESLLDTPHFTVKRLKSCESMPLRMNGNAFALLTALSEGIITIYDPPSGSIPLKAGQTALLPAQCADIALTGGCFLLASPGGTSA